MTSRAQVENDAIELVRSGASVDVIGRRLSGRTTFLRDLKTQLEEEGWRTLWVSGNAFLQSSALSALDLAGLVDGAARGRSSLQSALDSVIEAARSGRFVVLIDDWDSLDEVSWGIIVAGQQRVGFPIVRITPRRRSLQASPTGGREAQSLRTFVVDLAPMRADELEQVLSAHLNGAVDSSTASRILAKSGGLVGLALDIADAAVANGSLQRSDGVWHADADLWSDSLTRIAEAYIAGVSEEELDVLEALALVGELDVDDARRALDWRAVESLEDRALVRLYSIGARQLVTVVPPLVTELLRHQTHRARRERILHDFLDRGILNGDSVAERLSSLGMRTWQQTDAMYVRAFDEHVRGHRATSRARWLIDPSPANAVPYVQILNEQHADLQEVADVFESTNIASGDDESRARFSVLTAWWMAGVDDDLDGGLAFLESMRPKLGRYARLLDAATVDIQSTFRAIPSDVEDLLRLDGIDQLPVAVQDKIHESRVATFFSLGQFEKARAALQSMSGGHVGTSIYALDLLPAMFALFDGEIDATVESSTAAFHKARVSLDALRLRSNAYVSALGLTLSGRRIDAQPFIDVAVSLGRAPRIPQIVQPAIAGVGALLAFRRGDADGAAMLQAQNRALPFPDAAMLPLGGWPEAQQAILAGNVAIANAELWRNGLAHWERGGRIAGLLNMFAAVELEYSKDRAAALEEYVDLVDARFFHVLLDLVRADAAKDEPALLKAAADLAAIGLPGRALTAIKKAQTVRNRRGARELDNDLRKLVDELGIDPTLSDPFDFLDVMPKLSPREVEVAQLAAEGLSNQQIAESLALSVRTVENHIHRILRKTGIDSRDGLTEFMKAASAA